MRKKDLIQLSITGFLVIVLFLFWAGTFRKTHRLLPLDANNVAFQGAVYSVTVKDRGNLYDLLEQRSKSIELKRDPFSVSVVIFEKNLHTDISLTGIFWDKAKPLAIIDGNVVKKGQRVGNKTVMEIKQDRVVLSDGQVFSEIRLAQ